MFTLLILINFILLSFLFFNFSKSRSSSPNLRLSNVKGLISITFFIWITTECLSFFKQMTFLNIVLAELVFMIVLFALSIYYSNNINLKIRSILPFDSYKKLVFLAIILFIVPLFFLALYYPPINADSLGYHLPRLEHWIQNKSVAHYNANDIRQIYTPPLSEFILLHLKILSGNDFWLNLVQFFAMLGCVLLISLIISMFGLNYKLQILGSILALFIPMGILQSTTTQTDYVVAFFLSAFVYFGLSLIVARKMYVSNAAWGAMALAFGILTKYTILVFAVPFALWGAFVLLKRDRRLFLSILSILIFFVFSINLPFWVRNYFKCGHFLGEPRLAQMMRNEKLNVPFFASNLMRNLSMHMAFPLANRLFNKSVIKFHKKILHINPEDEAITFCSEPYEPYFCISEDASGNFFLIFLLFFVILFFIFNFKRIFIENSYMVWYLCCLLAGYFLFTGIFKWQPWITRLDLPLFVISIPFLIYILNKIFSNEHVLSNKLFLVFIVGLSSYWFLTFAIKNQWLLFISLFLSVVVYFTSIKNILKENRTLGIFIFSSFFVSFPYVYFNSVKPLLYDSHKFFASREFKYFWANQKEYEKYLFIADVIKKYKTDDINILSCGCITEYRLWVILKNRFGNEVSIKHLDSKGEEVDFSKKSKYSAIVSYLRKENNKIKNENIKYCKELGDERNPLSIMIFKNKDFKKELV